MNERNVAALTAILREVDGLIGSEILAIKLAARGVLVPVALTDHDVTHKGADGVHSGVACKTCGLELDIPCPECDGETLPEELDREARHLGLHAPYDNRALTERLGGLLRRASAALRMVYEPPPTPSSRTATNPETR